MKKKETSTLSKIIEWPGPILGLDLSLTGTGWYLSTKEGSIGHGVIGTDKITGLERLSLIKYYIHDDIIAKFPGDTRVIMEDFGFGTKGRGFEIGGLGYIVRMSLWEEDIPYTLVAPTVLKKFCCGKGNVDKNVILKEVYKRWKFDTNDDNIADAFVLNRIGCQMVGREEPQTSIQKMIVEEYVELG